MCAVLSHSVMSNSLQPHGLQPTRLLCPWGFSRQEYWSGLPGTPQGDLPNPVIEPRSPTLQVDSLLSEPPGKPKNTGMGFHALLQGIFPTQETIRGLLNCRQILYHLRCWGSSTEKPNRCQLFSPEFQSGGDVTVNKAGLQLQSFLMASIYCSLFVKI